MMCLLKKLLGLFVKILFFFDSTMKRIEVVTNSVYDDGVYAVVLVGNLFFVRERLVGSKAFSPQQIQFVLQNQVSAEELFMRLLVNERDVVAVRPLSVKIVPNSMKALTVNLRNSDVVYSCEYQRTCTRSAFFLPSLLAKVSMIMSELVLLLMSLCMKVVDVGLMFGFFLLMSFVFLVLVISGFPELRDISLMFEAIMIFFIAILKLIQRKISIIYSLPISIIYLMKCLPMLRRFC